MELRFRATLERRFDQVREVLSLDPEVWLPESKLSEGAVIVDLGMGEGTVRLHRFVRVTVGPVQLFGWGIVVPIEWRAARHPRL